jgi:hypothetical protein
MGQSLILNLLNELKQVYCASIILLIQCFQYIVRAYYNNYLFNEFNKFSNESTRMYIFY